MRLVALVCDICRGAGWEVEATHPDVPVALEGRPVRRLDLCDEHYDSLIRPLAQALATFGTGEVKMPRPRRKGRDHNANRAGPFQCQVDDCGAVLKHTGTLWQHLRGMHGLSIEDYRAAYGEPVPLTPEELAGTVVEAACQEDGCGQVYSTELGHRFPQSALSTHMWARHAIKIQGGQRVPHGSR